MLRVSFIYSTAPILHSVAYISRRRSSVLLLYSVEIWLLLGIV